MTDDDVLRLKDAKQLAWERDCERMELAGRVPTSMLAFARKVYMAGYCAGRIDQIFDDEENDDDQ